MKQLIVLFSALFPTFVNAEDVCICGQSQPFLYRHVNPDLYEDWNMEMFVWQVHSVERLPNELNYPDEQRGCEVIVDYVMEGTSIADQFAKMQFAVEVIYFNGWMPTADFEEQMRRTGCNATS